MTPVAKQERGRAAAPSKSTFIAVAWAAGGVALIGAAGFFAYWFSLLSLVLPTELVEGPLVQMLGPETATVVWFTSRPDSTDTFRFVVDGRNEKTLSVEREGTRHKATLTGLSPDTRYAYTIALPSRVLAAASCRSAKPSGKAFTFLVFGDSGMGGPEQYRLAARMTDYRPDFIVHTGDLIYPGGERWHYRERFFEPYAPLIREVPFWPSLGNHDVGKRNRGEPFREVFDLPRNGPSGEPPENNYWFEYADARFVILDTNVKAEDLRDEIAPWCEQALASATTRWKFVVFHHPPYTNGKHTPNQSVRDFLVPVFDRTGVDVVFCGHDHLYERTVPMRGGAAADGGVVYVVSGAGGAELYKLKKDAPTYFAASYDGTHGFTVIGIDGETLSLRQVDVDGKTIDDWSMSKKAGPRSPSSATPG